MKTYEMILAAALAIWICLVVETARARPGVLSFWPSPSETNTTGGIYSMYVQPTNAPDVNAWAWVAQCPEGQTNIAFDTAQIPPQCLVSATYGAGTNASPRAVPVFFDINAFSNSPVTNGAPAALQPPGGLNIQLN